MVGRLYLPLVGIRGWPKSLSETSNQVEPLIERRLDMPSARYRGPPMTLANMRQQGVRSLWVKCDLCHHEAVVNVDRYAGEVPVQAFGPRMVCTACGIVGASARPHRQEREPQEGLSMLRKESVRNAKMDG